MENLSFGARLWLALVLPFKVLFDGRFAALVAHLDAPALPPAKAPPEPAKEDTAPPAAASAVEAEVDPTPALQLLAILQREGRFIDFVREDMGGFGDAEIGAAARVVQEGCKRALLDYVEVRAIRSESEGAAVRLEAGYDAQRTRVTGNVQGAAPYSGVLAHHGWHVERITLPKLSPGHDARILAPAEVEVVAR
jgi:hypothetical protein